MYLRIADSRHFLITVLDAFSRYVVHWNRLRAMTAADVRRVIEEGLQLSTLLRRQRKSEL